eukprot:10051-Heterococcus_DN1.PRE.4
MQQCILPQLCIQTKASDFIARLVGALCWAVAITAVAAAAVHASGVYTTHTIVVHCVSKVRSFLRRYFNDDNAYT